MRREKSEQHAAAAEQAAARAFESDDLDLRREAARESGVALALDPSNVDARKTLLELFTRPPKQVPAAVQASLDADQTTTMRSFYRESMVAMAVYAPLLLALLFVGLRERWIVPAALASGTLFLLLCVYGLRRATPRSYVPLAMHACTCISLLFFARVFTPLLVLPVLAAMNVMVAAAYPGSAPRWSFALVGMLPVLGAGALELAGVWAPTMSWHDGALVLQSMLELGDWPQVIPLLVLFSAFPLIVGTLLIGRVQRLGEDIARSAHVQRWQLEQIVPRE